MKDTPVWEAVRAVADSGVLVAAGSAAAAVCDPLTDPRGGGFTIGLGLISGLAIASEAETWTEERRVRTRRMVGGFALAELPPGAALVRRTVEPSGPATWEVVGDGVELLGTLPV
jgi:cyanophycinase